MERRSGSKVTCGINNTQPPARSQTLIAIPRTGDAYCNCNKSSEKRLVYWMIPKSNEIDVKFEKGENSPFSMLYSKKGKIPLFRKTKKGKIPPFRCNIRKRGKFPFFEKRKRGKFPFFDVIFEKGELSPLSPLSPFSTWPIILYVFTSH